MEEDSKSVRKTELVVLRKTGCFGIQYVREISNQSNHKEKQECYKYLYSGEYSKDKGHL